MRYPNQRCPNCGVVLDDWESRFVQDDWLIRGWVNATEAARRVGVNANTVRRWVSRDGMPAKREGGKWSRLMIHMPSLERWLQRRKEIQVGHKCTSKGRKG